MGTTKQETQQQATPTAEETELNKLQLEQQRAINPAQIELQQQAFSLGSLLLQGQDLPGFLGPLPQGATAGQIPLSAGRLGEDITSEIVQKSLTDLFPQLQAKGIPLEGGVAASIAGRTAGDIRRGVAESNIERELGIRETNLGVSQATQFQNLNNLLNLLNLAVGGQAQIQAPVIGTSGQLGQRLAGLRTTTGSQTQNFDFFTSPLTTSFAQGFGSSLGPT